MYREGEFVLVEVIDVDILDLFDFYKAVLAVVLLTDPTLVLGSSPSSPHDQRLSAVVV